MRRTGNKFGVAPASEREFNGRTYASKAERMYAELLTMRQESGDILGFIQQPRFTLGCPENVYIPDFLIIYSSRISPIVVDVKGVETQKFKRDKKLWMRYGWLPLHVVKRTGKRFKTVETIIPNP